MANVSSVSSEVAYISGRSSSTSLLAIYVSAVEVSYMLPKTCDLVAKFCMAQYHSRCQDTGAYLVAMGRSCFILLEYARCSMRTILL